MTRSPATRGRARRGAPPVTPLDALVAEALARRVEERAAGVRTRGQLAEAVGVHPRHLSRYTRGVTPLPAAAAELLAGALDIDPVAVAAAAMASAPDKSVAISGD